MVLIYFVAGYILGRSELSVFQATRRFGSSILMLLLTQATTVLERNSLWRPGNECNWLIKNRKYLWMDRTLFIVCSG